MRASDFEFHHRFWFIVLVYFVSFGLYYVDHVNVVEALVRWNFGQGDPHLHSMAARHTLQALFTLSATLLGAAALMRTWGSAYLRAEVVHDTKLHVEKLVADGPFRHLRNPLYFGNMLAAAGFAMTASRTGAVVLILGNLIIVLRLIGREEAALIESQGDAYRAFCSAVPKLWPSLRPRLPSGGAHPIWLPAFLSEAWIWIFAINTYVFAGTLDGQLYGRLMWSSAAIYFLAWGVVRRLRRHKSAPPSAVPNSQAH
jgi:protein-S-isoprenylcysteine O-methyltransferase Ste14